ncbi:WASH complex subunit 2 [Scaptodrosophila lebanonensis]|uniref:WASH complex subunit 2 n=1 Tax=Drosophila lebanonensis TaxID=7225 RepID=A0A6J2U3U7_DROLE|nr:WASH complex subunit 2 [Scaptodrosophila lebanonensis]
MDITEDVDAILAQSPDWSFAGDCAILDLMKRISENLYNCVERTNSDLREFDAEVKRTEIALDNATNSLRSLQFGQQFVEYRIETLDDADFKMPETKKKSKHPDMSCEQMQKEFLQNNVEMFRKHFEPITLKVPDSDDEDDGDASTTTIFRIKNPYDDTPLPYIIGTKEWHDHKYAGIYDSAESSDDEKTEEFSSSSSDEAQLPTKPKVPATVYKDPDEPPLSSIAKDPVIVLPKAPIIPSVPPMPAGQLGGKTGARPKTQPRQIISSTRNHPEHDLFAALRQSPPSDDPPSTSSTPTSSPAISKRPAQRILQTDSSLSSSSSSASKPNIVQRESPANKDVTSTSVPWTPAYAETEAVNEKPVSASKIKRKPVNLFNDDDFNSLMSEIADKAQSKAEISVPVPKVGPTQKEERRTIIKENNEQKLQEKKPTATAPLRKTVNLFDDSPPPSPSPIVKASTAPTVQPPPAGPTVKPPLTGPSKLISTSLFEDDLEDEDFLDRLTKFKKPIEKQPKTFLFDDEDDDLDIDDIFPKKAESKSKITSKPNPTIKTSLFDDDMDDNMDIFGEQKAVVPIEQNIKISSETDDKTTKTQGSSKTELKGKPNVNTSLFDDDEDNVDLFGSKKQTVIRGNAKMSLIEADPQQKSFMERKQPKKLTLFDDENDDDLDIFRGAPPKKTIKGHSEEKIVPELKKDLSPQKSTLFEDIINDSFNDFSGHPSSKTDALFAGGGDFKPTSTENMQDDQEHRAFKDKERMKTNDPESAQTEGKPVLLDVSEDVHEMFAEPNQKTQAVNSPFDGDKLREGFSNESLKNIASEDQKRAEIKKQTQTGNITKHVDEIKNLEINPPFASKDVGNQMALESASLIEQSSKDEQKVLNTDQQTAETAHKFEEGLPEDPIISMVADVSNKKENITHSPPKASDVAAAQQIMQNYTSLFSDEPPDDNEFFLSLGSNSLNSLNASKIFDTEHDFFEPTLPDVPSTSKAASATSVEPQSGSEYSGMRLFSDVPPDDDHDDGSKQKEENYSGMKTVMAPTGTRIHTIFYDDFSETARASEPETSTQPSSLYDNEPPPDFLNTSSKVANVVDQSKANVEEQIAVSGLPMISKLKMPNININVQALLPGAGGLPKPKKSPAATKEPEDIIIASDKSERTEPSPSNENILQNVTKTRVRGPAHRRPSTRRGRQDNYRKSLLAEAEPKVVDAITGSLPPGTKEIRSTVNIPSQTVKAPIPKTSFLDTDDSDDDNPLFGSAKALPARLINTEPPPAPTKLPPGPTKPPPPARLFSDSDEDDDFFASVPAVPSRATQTAAQKASNSLFSDEDDDDDLFGSVATGGTTRQRKSASSLQKKKVESVNKVAQSKTSVATSPDNPLADLLGP